VNDELYAIEMQLAQRLFETMERLDPSPEETAWNGLSDREREFYRLCVDALVEWPDRLNLAIRLANHS
jgi:hypothetical protein